MIDDISKTAFDRAIQAGRLSVMTQTAVEEVVTDQQAILRRNLIVSHEQMLALNATPISLVDAPTETAYVIPVAILWLPVGWHDHPYSGPPMNPHTKLGTITDPGGAADLIDWNFDGDPLYQMVTTLGQVIAGASLFLSAESEITGGDAGNSLGLSVLYTIIDLTA